MLEDRKAHLPSSRVVVVRTLHRGWMYHHACFHVEVELLGCVKALVNRLSVYPCYVSIALVERHGRMRRSAETPSSHEGGLGLEVPHTCRMLMDIYGKIISRRAKILKAEVIDPKIHPKMRDR